MATLIIRSGKHDGKKLLLPDSDVTIGRDEDCQIQLASDDISGKHCILRCTPDGLVVRDLGSRSGTLVNEVPISSDRLLVPGDRIRVGPILLEVPAEKTTEPGQDAGSEAPSSDQIVTADAIAGWLTEDEEEIDSSGSTTIIDATSPIAADDASEAENDSPSDADAEPSRRKKFKSVGEEGTDIIRRWKEHVAREGE